VKSFSKDLSLLQQIGLLKSGQVVHLHIKIVDPSWNIQPPWRASIDEMIENMRLLFGMHGIAVAIHAIETLNVPPELWDIEITDIGPSEEFDLDDYAKNVNKFHIAVFFIRNLIPPKNGVAFPGVPDILVAQDASKWTLAHEVGHVLSLDHVDDRDEDPPFCLFDRLMTSCSTSSINVSVPILSNSEIEDMKDDELTMAL
jgi:hypothetical protein